MSRYDILQNIFDSAEDDYYSLTQEEKAVYNLKSIYDAVNGAGLLSYYQSYAGGYASDALDNLYSVGMEEIAAIIDSANAIFPECMPPEDTEERLEIIDEWEGEYDALFDEWTEEILEFAPSLMCELEKLIEELDT
ncbi:MAG: DUF4375 domain-containing protein [Clostridia bacterium]|nr:DUF4375 domain-containing protein [Clostridia bacterium]